MTTSPRWLGRTLALLLVAWAGAALHAAPTLPAKPDRYFIDEAHVVDGAAASQISEQLAQFERDTSNQILVAIYPSLPPDAELAQYATLTYNAWGVGQKGPSVGQKGGNNGAILFVFVNDHKMFIATGRGLEGALPDATCRNIIDGVIAPAFKQGDYAGGVRAGVNAMIAATKGEYIGTGVTHAEETQPNGDDQGLPGWIIVVAFILLFILCRGFFPLLFYSPYIFTSGGFGGGGFGGGGGGGGFGGGGGGGFSGFSGGGGMSAGGGAGGSW